ncbi:hypothetical protein [Chryseobacterium sp. YIM B08800]|uniref:hypothetical protein n=1 Tax=Chryseobacterium sp. YIM B08800 TaxID=2984136 RepID=UPI00223EDC9F|nr:hypothetical protein [Chryseobacterium sp. YIM B08800]
MKGKVDIRKDYEDAFGEDKSQMIFKGFKAFEIKNYMESISDGCFMSLQLYRIPNDEKLDFEFVEKRTDKFKDYIQKLRDSKYKEVFIHLEHDQIPDKD